MWKRKYLMQKSRINLVKQASTMSKKRHESFVRACRINEFKFVKGNAKEETTFF